MKDLNLKVLHRTTYTFSEEVFLEPHTLLLRPKPSQYCRIQHFALKVLPAPAGDTLLIDPTDNFAHHVWFNGMTRSLVVEAHSEVSLLPFAPLDFLLYPFESGELGFSYPPHLQAVLGPYLHEEDNHADVKTLVDACMEKHGKGTIDFIVGSTAFVHANFDRIMRVEGHAMTPGETIARGKGSCRDLSRLHMAILRHAGLAARFVSGYLYLGPESEEHELHAWTEVYVPGGGWVGADPTIGLLTGNDHIRLATAHSPHATLPVQGTYRGKATVHMKADLEITAL